MENSPLRTRSGTLPQKHLAKDDVLKAIVELCDVVSQQHDIVFLDTHYHLYVGMVKNEYSRYDVEELVTESIRVATANFSWYRKFNYITMLSVFKLASRRIDTRGTPSWYQRYIVSIKEDYYSIYELGAWNSHKFLTDFFYNERVNAFNSKYHNVQLRKAWLLEQYDDLLEWKKIKWSVNTDRLIKHRVKQYIIDN